MIMKTFFITKCLIKLMMYKCNFGIVNEINVFLNIANDDDTRSGLSKRSFVTI